MTKIGSTISYTPKSSHNRSYTSQTNRNIKNSSLFVTNNKLNKNNNRDLENYKISLRVSSVNNYDEDNNCISSSFKKEDIDILNVYYCPHNPDEDCSCRKPKAGMILQSLNDFEIGM